MPELAPFALACAAAFSASILGGLAGYGTGLVLPVFLAPVVGVEALVPVMGVAMLFTNGSRVVAFRHDVRWPEVRTVLLPGLPACLLGAWGYTLLSGRGIAALIGLPLYVCATGSTPLAAMLLVQGLSPGAVLALLLTGPATNFTTFGVLTRLHGGRVAAVFALAMWLGAVGLGYLATFILQHFAIRICIPDNTMLMRGYASHEHRCIKGW